MSVCEKATPKQIVFKSKSKWLLAYAICLRWRHQCEIFYWWFRSCQEIQLLPSLFCHAHDKYLNWRFYYLVKGLSSNTNKLIWTKTQWYGFLNVFNFIYSICPIDTSSPDGPQMVECGSICPSSYANVTTVWYEYEQGRKPTMCKVIRPWQQIVYYMQCG